MGGSRSSCPDSRETNRQNALPDGCTTAAGAPAAKRDHPSANHLTGQRHGLVLIMGDVNNGLFNRSVSIFRSCLS
jgi:hypothetical protein